MKHIVLVTPTLGGGGAERTTLFLANGLAGLGYRVTLAVASTQGGKGALKFELSLLVELLDFDCGRMLSFFMPFSKWLRIHEPDVVMSSQTHTNILVYLSTRLAGYTGKVIAREVSTASVNLKHVTGVKKYFIQTMMRFAYHRVHSLVTVSQGVAEDLQKYLNTSFSNLTMIYDPVITEDLYIKSQMSLDHPWFSEDRKIPVVLAAGRLTEAKNYPLLIKAFEQLVKKIPAHLVILGEGEDRSSLEQLLAKLSVENLVSLYGFDSNPYRYMVRCDVYVMSSTWEGLPGALIQALALGARVISTDCPSGPREILKNGLYGKLVKMNCVDSLELALLELLQGEQSIHVPTDFGREFMIDVVLQQYAELID